MTQADEYYRDQSEDLSKRVPSTPLFTLHSLVESRNIYSQGVVVWAFTVFVGILIWQGPLVASITSLTGTNPIPLVVIFCSALLTALLAGLLHLCFSSLTPRAIHRVALLSCNIAVLWIPGTIVLWVVRGWSGTWFYLLILILFTAIVVDSASRLSISAPILGLGSINLLRHSRAGRPGLYASRRYVYITFWLVASGVMWIVGGTLAVVIRIALRAGGIPFSALFARIVANPLLSGASTAAWHSRRYSSPKAREFMARDRRRPILLLRSFADDDTKAYETGTPLQQWFTSARRFEEVIADELWAWGPVVALGRPGEPLPVSGAVRDYIEGEFWQKHIQHLAVDAAAIIVVLGWTSSLSWELAMIVNEGLISKTIIIVPPVSESEYVRRYYGLKENDPSGMLMRLFEAEPAEAAILMFDLDGTLVALSAPHRTPAEYREALYVAVAGLFSRIAAPNRGAGAAGTVGPDG